MRHAALAALALSLAACGPNRDCQPGTVLITVELGAAAQADSLVVEVTVSGGPSSSSTLPHTPGASSGTVKVVFPHGYPRGQQISVRIVALSGSTPLGEGTVGRTLDAECGTLRLTLGAALDSGTDEDGGVDAGEDAGTDAGADAGIVPPLDQLTLLAGKLGGAGSLDGTGGAARFYYPAGLALDPIGQILYVSEQRNCTIRRIDLATQAVTTIAGVPGWCEHASGTGSAARFYLPAGMALSGTGLYIADYAAHVVRQMSLTTGVVGTIGIPNSPGSANGPFNSAQFHNPIDVGAQPVSPFNILIADAGNCALRSIDNSGMVSTPFGASGDCRTADGGIGTARLNVPGGVTLNNTNGWISEQAGNVIRRWDFATGTLITLAGTALMAGSTNGTGSMARFSYPNGVTTLGPAGTTAYVADTVNSSIRAVDTGGVVTTLAGTAGANAYQDGTGTAAHFVFPQAVVGTTNTLYVADTADSVIRKIDVPTQAVTTLAGSPATRGVNDGVGAAARFNLPTGIASDGGDTLYLADFGSHSIRRITVSTGEVITLAGVSTSAGSMDGPLASASFRTPMYAVVDRGTLYISDTGNHTIRKIDLAGAMVSTVAGTAGMPGNTDAVGAAARFYSPRALVADGAGKLYVADAVNSRIRVITLADGTVSTLAGSSYGYLDGFGITAQFRAPEGLAWDGAKTLYVSDGNSHTLRKVDLTTASVTTVAGKDSVLGNADGDTTSARFNTPTGLALAEGALWVGDTGNSALRRVDLASGVVSTHVGIPNRASIVLGGLPAGLSYPRGLAWIPNVGLAIVSVAENAVLLLR